MDENARVYAAARAIADIFHQTAAAYPSIRANRGEVQYISSSHQTVSGLYLRLYYGAPHSLWTPWGEWRFAKISGFHGDADLRGLLERFLGQLHVTLFQPESNTQLGTFGPVYAVLAVQGQRLPIPRLRERKQFLSYEEAASAWRQLTAAYRPRTR